MSWLDAFLNAGYTTILVNGVALPVERALEFVGAATGADNAALGRTEITVGEVVPGGGSPVSGALGTLAASTAAFTIDISIATGAATTCALPTAGLFDKLQYIFTYTSGAVPGAPPLSHSLTITAPSSNIDTALNGPGLSGILEVGSAGGTGQITLTYNAALSRWIQT
jgi:hypothetical protein